MTHSNHLDPAMPTSEAACRQVEDLLAQAIAFLVKGSNPDNLPTRREALAIARAAYFISLARRSLLLRHDRANFPHSVRPNVR
ncbi:hypothetical protein [uncultured Nocardioides sp.]|uniref:hypothetical protein n=1 Tax=uncultured Nocardioides sp. TaxID=198441 RepID=UPI0026087E18|nr:hypothetical protein [uncultured Nocardioides sp.]